MPVKKELTSPPPIPSFGNPTSLVKADAWYITEEGNIAGGIAITSSLLMFHPILGDQMKCLSQDGECKLSAKCFQTTVDLADVNEIGVMVVPETSEYFLHLWLATANGQYPAFPSTNPLQP
jgi:hypothetical protein